MLLDGGHLNLCSSVLGARLIRQLRIELQL
jgi:hypothetical protein